MLDDEIDNEVKKILETRAKHEPGSAELTMTINELKDHMKNLLNIKRLI